MKNTLSSFFSILWKDITNTDRKPSPQYKNQLKMIRLFEPQEEIIIPVLEDGFSFIRYTPGLEHRWMDLINASHELGTWNPQKFSQAVISSLLPQGGVLVAQHDNLIACSAVCLKDKFFPYAILLNVLVLPEFRGHGISKAMVADGIATCKHKGIPGIILYTDDFRLAAINVYLELGFQPDMDASIDAKPRWQKVFSNLNNHKTRQKKLFE
jgi:mycothiol synthase